MTIPLHRVIAAINLLTDRSTSLGDVSRSVETRGSDELTAQEQHLLHDVAEIYKERLMECARSHSREHDATKPAADSQFYQSILRANQQWHHLGFPVDKILLTVDDAAGQWRILGTVGAYVITRSLWAVSRAAVFSLAVAYTTLGSAETEKRLIEAGFALHHKGASQHKTKYRQ